MKLKLGVVCLLAALFACDRSRIQSRSEPEEVEADGGAASGGGGTSGVEGGGAAETGGGSPEVGGGSPEIGGGSTATGGGTSPEPPCSIEEPECSFFAGDAGTGPVTPAPWARAIFPRGNSFGSDVLLDAFGDVVVAGIISGPADFGSGQVSVDHFYPFVVKYAADGKLRWLRILRDFQTAAHGPGDLYGWVRMALAPDGTIFLAGAKQTDPTDEYSVVSDLFLVSLTRDGAIRWRAAHPPAHNYQVSAIAVDAQDAVWVGGAENAPQGNAFIAKFSAGTGAFLQGLQMQSTTVASIAVLSDHSVVFGGSLSGTLRIPPAAPVVSTDVASYDAYLVRLGPTGVPMWGRLYGSEGGQYVSEIKADGQGGVLLYGYFAGTLVGLGNLVSSGPEEENPFLARVGGDGVTQWSRAVAGRQPIASYHLVSADAQGVMVAQQSELGRSQTPEVTLRILSPQGTPLSSRVFADGADVLSLSRRGGAMVLGGLHRTPGTLLGLVPVPAGNEYFIAYFPR